MLKNINKILIITGVRIGDQLMTTPFLRAVRNTFPRSKISLATGLPALDVLKNNPRIDECLLIDKNILKKLIRRGRFDLAIDLCGLKDTAYLSLISGARHRIGFDDAEYSSIRKRKGLSFIDSYLLFAKKIGLKLQGRKTEIFLTKDKLNKAKKIFRNKGLNRKDFVVGVFVSGSRKRILWQPERFGRLADKIADKFKAKILFFYDADEIGGLKKAASVMKNSYFLSGVHDIGTTAGLVSLCDCVIVSNRGPMHVAAALQIPVIAIFGPYSEDYFFPYSKKDNLIVTKKIGCRPCYMEYKVCTKNIKCLKSLSVDEVWEKIVPFLKRLIKRRKEKI